MRSFLLKYQNANYKPLAYLINLNELYQYA